MGFQGLVGFGGGATGLSQAGAGSPGYTEATGGIISDYTEPGPGKHYRAHVFFSIRNFCCNSSFHTRYC